jgi:ABC-2 type transport system ATP-binding protein
MARHLLPVRLQDLQHRAGSFQALDGVSFDIQQGEFFGLLGPNARARPP